jgi:hypothetical protein
LGSLGRSKVGLDLAIAAELRIVVVVQAEQSSVCLVRPVRVGWCKFVLVVDLDRMPIVGCKLDLLDLVVVAGLDRQVVGHLHQVVPAEVQVLAGPLLCGEVMCKISTPL